MARSQCGAGNELTTSAPGATTSGLISRSPWVGPWLLKPAMRLVSSGEVTYSPSARRIVVLAVVVVDDGAVLQADHDAGDRRLRLEAVVRHHERRLAASRLTMTTPTGAGVLRVAHLHREVARAATEQRDRAGKVGQRRATVAGDREAVRERAVRVGHDRSGAVRSSVESPELADDGLVVDAVDVTRLTMLWPTVLAPAVSARGAAPG